MRCLLIELVCELMVVEFMKLCCMMLRIVFWCRVWRVFGMNWCCERLVECCMCVICFVMLMRKSGECISSERCWMLVVRLLLLCVLMLLKMLSM